MYCSKCGNFINEGSRFCPGCGAPVFPESSDTSPGTYPVSESADNSRAYGVVAYLTWVGFIITLLLSDKNNGYVRFHLNQALALDIVMIAVSILTMIPFIGIIIGSITGIVLLVLWGIAVYGAWQGLMKPLPILGQIKLLR